MSPLTPGYEYYDVPQYPVFEQAAEINPENFSVFGSTRAELDDNSYEFLDLYTVRDDYTGFSPPDSYWINGSHGQNRVLGNVTVEFISVSQYFYMPVVKFDYRHRTIEPARAYIGDNPFQYGYYGFASATYGYGAKFVRGNLGNGGFAYQCGPGFGTLYSYDRVDENGMFLSIAESQAQADADLALVIQDRVAQYENSEQIDYINAVGLGITWGGYRSLGQNTIPARLDENFKIRPGYPYYDRQLGLKNAAEPQYLELLVYDTSAENTSGDDLEPGQIVNPDRMKVVYRWEYEPPSRPVNPNIACDMMESPNTSTQEAGRDAMESYIEDSTGSVLEGAFPTQYEQVMSTGEDRQVSFTYQGEQINLVIGRRTLSEGGSEEFFPGTSSGNTAVGDTVGTGDVEVTAGGSVTTYLNNGRRSGQFLKFDPYFTYNPFRAEGENGPYNNRVVGFGSGAAYMAHRMQGDDWTVEFAGSCGANLEEAEWRDDQPENEVSFSELETQLSESTETLENNGLTYPRPEVVQAAFEEFELRAFNKGTVPTPQTFEDGDLLFSYTGAGAEHFEVYIKRCSRVTDPVREICRRMSSSDPEVREQGRREMEELILQEEGTSFKGAFPGEYLNVLRKGGTKQVSFFSEQDGQEVRILLGRRTDPDAPITGQSLTADSEAPESIAADGSFIPSTSGDQTIELIATDFVEGNYPQVGYETGTGATVPDRSLDSRAIFSEGPPTGSITFSGGAATVEINFDYEHYVQGMDVQSAGGSSYFANLRSPGTIEVEVSGAVKDGPDPLAPDHIPYFSATATDEEDFAQQLALELFDDGFAGGSSGAGTTSSVEMELSGSFTFTVQAADTDDFDPSTIEVWIYPNVNEADGGEGERDLVCSFIYGEIPVELPPDPYADDPPLDLPRRWALPTQSYLVTQAVSLVEPDPLIWGPQSSAKLANVTPGTPGTFGYPAEELAYRPSGAAYGLQRLEQEMDGFVVDVANSYSSTVLFLTNKGSVYTIGARAFMAYTGEPYETYPVNEVKRVTYLPRIKKFLSTSDLSIAMLTGDDKLCVMGNSLGAVEGWTEDEANTYFGLPYVFDEIDNVVDAWVSWNSVIIATQDGTVYGVGYPSVPHYFLMDYENPGPDVDYWWETPQVIEGAPKVKQLGGRAYALWALDDQGDVWTWGYNVALGAGIPGFGMDEYALSTPQKVQIPEKVKYIDGSYYSQFAITESGRLFCCPLTNYSPSNQYGEVRVATAFPLGEYAAKGGAGHVYEFTQLPGEAVFVSPLDTGDYAAAYVAVRMDDGTIKVVYVGERSTSNRGIVDEFEGQDAGLVAGPPTTDSPLEVTSVSELLYQGGGNPPPYGLFNFVRLIEYPGDGIEGYRSRDLILDGITNPTVLCQRMSRGNAKEREEARAAMEAAVLNERGLPLEDAFSNQYNRTLRTGKQTEITFYSELAGRDITLILGRRSV